MVGETLNATETMKLLRISRRTLRQMLAAGEIHGFTRGKVVRVSRRSVEQLLGGVNEIERRTARLFTAEAH